MGIEPKWIDYNCKHIGIIDLSLEVMVPFSVKENR